MSLDGGGANDNSPTRLNLSTQEGPLPADRQRHVGSRRGSFPRRGPRRRADEAALSNLLNIIGRRDGARSVISIG
jgi:general secretion pathway protein N